MGLLFTPQKSRQYLWGDEFIFKTGQESPEFALRSFH